MTAAVSPFYSLNLNFEKQIILFDRAIDRVSKKNMDMPKINILFKFPNLYPGTKTMIVLKQPKSDDTIRNVDIPQSVLNALLVLKEMQDKLKKELGPDGYMDYNLTIYQANGRPIMTEHLNKRFKEILTEMNDPDMDPQEIVFHSLRHSSTTYKLKLNHGDLKATQGDTGHAQIDMITDVYAHILYEDRKVNAQKFEATFYAKNPVNPLRDVKPPEETGTDLTNLIAALEQSPELVSMLTQALKGKAISS